MLLKLYEDGFLNYQALLFKYYQSLEMSEIELVVMNSILDIYKSSKKIRINKIVNATKLARNDVENALNNLMIKKLYAVIFVENENGISEERYSLEPFFNKLEDCFKSEAVLKVEEQLKEVITIFERESNRTISPMEYSIFEDFINKDGFSIEDIKNAIKIAVKQNKISLSFIEKQLLRKKENLLNGERPLDDRQKKDLAEAFKLI